MKKVGLLVLSAVLAAGVTQVYAKEGIKCPSVSDVRYNGGIFEHAFLNKDNEWDLIAAPFYTNDNQVWQINYRVKMPEVNDPVTALSVGQKYFNSSPLRATPINNGEHEDIPVFCFYEPEDSNYEVTATNSVVYGFKRK